MKKIALVAAALMVAATMAGSAMAGQQQKAADGEWLGAGRGVKTMSSHTGPKVEWQARNTLRVFGDNRFETAAAISQAMWGPDNAFVVFLATGEGFADALAIGPSTFFDGPLLLTARDWLPSITREELERLQPCMIVVVGGESAVNRRVLEEVDRYTVDCPAPSPEPSP